MVTEIFFCSIEAADAAGDASKLRGDGIMTEVEGVGPVVVV